MLLQWQVLWLRWDLFFLFPNDKSDLILHLLQKLKLQEIIFLHFAIFLRCFRKQLIFYYLLNNSPLQCNGTVTGRSANSKSISKSPGNKLPNWKHGIYRKVGNMEIIEFPLIKEIKSISITSVLTTEETKRVAEASLIRIAFIKRGNKIDVREIDYIPEWQYLQRKKFDISDVMYGKPGNDFTGRMIIKKWNETILSKRDVENGVLIKLGAKKINVRSGSVSSVPAEGECGYDCVYQQDCTDYYYPDGMYINSNCGPWYNTGECTPRDCPDGGGDPCSGMTPEECDCQVYGIGCDPPPCTTCDPPPPPDPCTQAQPAATAAANLSQNSAFTTAKSQIQTAASDGNEHGIVFGRDANGNIITSQMTTGSSSVGTLNSNISGAFADLHNHPDNTSPSAGDLYGFINHNGYDARYVITQNGTIYALVVLDRTLSNTFVTNHPKYQNPGYPDDFPDPIYTDFTDLKSYLINISGLSSGIADEMAMAFVLSKYNTGVALLKQDGNENFKRLNTIETIQTDGTKIYNATNCQ